MLSILTLHLDLDGRKPLIVRLLCGSRCQRLLGLEPTWRSELRLIGFGPFGLSIVFGLRPV